jgi:hypothetical protein
VATASGLVGVRILDLREGYDPGEGPPRSIPGVTAWAPPDTLPGLWARWDSNYYLTIADLGYTVQPEGMGHFPLYPLLMAGLSRLTGFGLELSGMIIAQLSYLAAVLIFYKLARQIRDDHGFAMRCVLALLLFPSSFFFFAIYAEPVYLALAVLGIFLALRAQPRYVAAGLALGLASTARPIGWLLNLVLLGEFVRRRKFNPPTLLAVGLGLALSVAGVALYMVYLHALTGSWTVILAAQTEWQRFWQLPWLVYWNSLRAALSLGGLRADWFMYAINGSDLLFTSLALALTAVAVWQSVHKRFSWSLSIYLLAALAFFMSSHGPDADPLWGMTRWIAVLFPLYLVVGDLSQRLPKVAQWGIALVAAAALVFLTAWWTSGRWVG